MSVKTLVCEVIGPDYVTVRDRGGQLHRLAAGDWLTLVEELRPGSIYQSHLEIERPAGLAALAAAGPRAAGSPEVVTPRLVAAYAEEQETAPGGGTWRDRGPLL